MPLGVVTTTGPVVAPAGTVAMISEGRTSMTSATVPLKVTLAGRARLVPRIFTVAPVFPEVGSVFTNGERSTDRRKIAPKKSPSEPVVP